MRSRRVGMCLSAGAIAVACSFPDVVFNSAQDGGADGGLEITAPDVGVAPDGRHLGGGRFHRESAEIARLREAVADDRTGAQLVAILDGLKGMNVGGEERKRVPKPWDA